MKAHILGITLLVSCLAFAIALPRNSVGPLEDFGPRLKDLIEELTRNISESGPIQLLPDEFELRINLTQIFELLYGEGRDLPMRGTLQLWGPAIVLDPVAVPVSSIILNGILRPLAIDLQLEAPKVGIEATYAIDAMLLDTIAVVGKGQLSFGAALFAGIIASMKVFPTPGSPVSFLEFDYLFNLRDLDVSLEGLEGSVSDLINDTFNAVLKEEVVPAVNGLEETYHSFVRQTLHDVLNAVVEPLTYQDILDILNLIRGSSAEIRALLGPLFPVVRDAILNMLAL